MPIRRRRRKRWTWFPIIGTQNGIPDNTDDTNGRVFGVPVDGSGASNAIAFPLLPDVQTDPDAALGQAAQIELALSTDYEIERIVGKCFVSASGPADAAAEIAPKVIHVGCGLFVAKQADAQAGGGVNLPFGAATQLELLENYNPISNDTARSPWMWKREWILSTGRPNLSPSNPSTSFMPVHSNVGGPNNLVTAIAPTSNTQYGSVMDGPHVDSKVNRRVRSDSRLWFIVAARSMDILFNNEAPTTNLLSQVQGMINIRVLGALRRPSKTGSFT